MSLEKTVVFAISALVGSCAALKSRKSRLQAGEALEVSLSNASSPVEEPTSRVVDRSKKDQRQSWILVVHALVTCCGVWILTDVPKWSEDVGLVMWCLGLVVGLVMHIVGHCSSVEQPQVVVPCLQKDGGVPIILDDYTCICNGRWMKDRYVVCMKFREWWTRMTVWCVLEFSAEMRVIRWTQYVI